MERPRAHAPRDLRSVSRVWVVLWLGCRHSACAVLALSGLPLRGSPAPSERADVFVGGSHTFSKRERQSITLLPGLGIEGDAHCGSTVRHLSDRKKYPNRPNLRQLHLIHMRGILLQSC